MLADAQRLADALSALLDYLEDDQLAWPACEGDVIQLRLVFEDVNAEQGE